MVKLLVFILFYLEPINYLITIYGKDVNIYLINNFNCKLFSLNL